MKTKTEIRKELAARICALPSQQKIRESEQLCKRVLEDPHTQSPCRIGIFLALPDEPDLRAAYTVLLERGCTLALPFPGWAFHWVDQFEAQSTGPWELELPVPGERIDAENLDLVLVPGRGFTEKGNRIGRGKGIYDQLLCKNKTRRIGIGFGCQLMESLPVEPHDILLTEVWTGS